MKKILPILFLILMLGPFILGMGYSLFYSIGWVGALSTGFTLQHWIDLFTANDALISLGYSIYLMVLSVLLVLIVAVLISFILFSSDRKSFPAWYFLPLTFAPVVAGFVWYYILSSSGILSRIVFNLGISSSIDAFPRMVNDLWGIGILVTHVFLVFPVFTLLFQQIARKENLYEIRTVSLTLGGSEFQFFRKLYLPIILKKAYPVIVLYGIFLFGTYEVPLILGVSSPRVVTLFITEKLTKYNLYEIPVGYAMAVLYGIVVCVAVILLVRKRNVRIV